MGELRKDAILGRWVIIAADRGKRPDAYAQAKQPPADDLSKCPFCEGKEKETPPEIYALRDPSTQPDERGWKVRVVANKFPALTMDCELHKKGFGLHDMMTNYGAHEVVIDSPDHTKEVNRQSIDELSDVISVIQYRIEELRKSSDVRYIIVFKNKGKEAGASLAHPHHQIMALPITPIRVREELKGAETYFRLKERCVYCDLIDQETESEERIVYENHDFVCFCPYASRFPFEMWILPKKHAIDFHRDNAPEKMRALSEALKTIIGKLDVALKDPEYNYIIHSAPNRFPRSGYWQTIEQDFHWHIELFPRLTRVAGFEWGSGFYINPVAPEAAAQCLREIKI